MNRCAEEPPAHFINVSARVRTSAWTSGWAVQILCITFKPLNVNESFNDGKICCAEMMAGWQKHPVPINPWAAKRPAGKPPRSSPFYPAATDNWHLLAVCFLRDVITEENKFCRQYVIHFIMKKQCTDACELFIFTFRCTALKEWYWTDLDSRLAILKTITHCVRNVPVGDLISPILCRERLKFLSPALNESPALIISLDTGLFIRGYDMQQHRGLIFHSITDSKSASFSFSPYTLFLMEVKK